MTCSAAGVMEQISTNITPNQFVNLYNNFNDDRFKIVSAETMPAQHSQKDSITANIPSYQTGATNQGTAASPSYSNNFWDVDNTMPVIKSVSQYASSATCSPQAYSYARATTTMAMGALATPGQTMYNGGLSTFQPGGLARAAPANALNYGALATISSPSNAVMSRAMHLPASAVPVAQNAPCFLKKKHAMDNNVLPGCSANQPTAFNCQ